LQYQIFKTLNLVYLQNGPELLDSVWQAQCFTDRGDLPQNQLIWR